MEANRIASPVVAMSAAELINPAPFCVNKPSRLKSAAADNVNRPPLLMTTVPPDVVETAPVNLVVSVVTTEMPPDATATVD